MTATQILLFALLVLIGTLTLAAQLGRVRHKFTVPDGFAGLLYHHGAFIAPPLGPGRHVRWGRCFEMRSYDLRPGTHEVHGQELLTADHVSLKVNLLVTCQLADVVKAVRETQDWDDALHHAAQIALRTVAGGVPAEALLHQRQDLDAQMLALIQPEATRIGLTVLSVRIMDVMLPAELKRAFADTVKARQEGQAALERARAESAALRSLANAARVLEGNPALMNLRVLQSLTHAQATGQTLVLGLPAGFVPVPQSTAASSKPEGPGDAQA